MNWRYQLRASLFSVCLALILLSILNVNVYFTNKASTESILVVSPELRASLAVKDRRQAIELVLGSVFLTLAVFALGIFQSHKTAGAAFSLGRTLNHLRDGCYNAAPRLRRDDHLQDLIASIDDLARALRAANAAEIGTLQAVVETLGGMAPEPARGEVTSKLLGLIQEKRDRMARSEPARRSP